jgi:hypothetical protein
MKNRQLNMQIGQQSIGAHFMRRLRVQRVPTSVSSIISLMLLVVGQAAYAEPQVSGRVLDEMQKPLAGVQLKLIGDEKLLKCLTVTKANGEFTLSHEKCKKFCLAVFPPKNSGLAAAWIDNIPGDATRHILVQLHPGFTIKGRVVRASNGKGLKGLNLDISPVKGNETEHEVHGSGRTITGQGGSFELTLTPGAKLFSVSNDRYSELVRYFDKQLLITDTGTIPDIALPEKE